MSDDFNHAAPTITLKRVIHLKAVTLRDERRGSGFPFEVPIIRALSTISFDRPVTFLVGENGSGKSTLLEGIACAVGSIAVGSAGVDQDRTLAHVRRLGDALAQSWTKRTRRGFFLRAEDFFGFAKRVSAMRTEAEGAIREIDERYADRSDFARRLAQGPHRRDLDEMGRRYGDGLDAQSHGESFLKLFRSRVVAGGLYLLDEPEAPLSPLRQLGLITLLKDMVDDDCQFLIATHSPILLAFPGATILSCDHVPIESVAYEDLEHVALTREFLNDPNRYLSQL